MCENAKQYIFIISAIFVLSSTLITVNASEKEPSETCLSASLLYKEGDVDGALEEVRWCVTQLEQMKQSKIGSYFKDEINGYKAGELASQQSMGMSSVERSYSKNGSIIKASLTGGALNISNSAFSALAQFGLNIGVTVKK